MCAVVCTFLAWYIDSKKTFRHHFNYVVFTHHENVPLDAARAQLLVGILDPRPHVLAVPLVPVGDRVTAAEFDVVREALEEASSLVELVNPDLLITDTICNE